MAARRPFGFGVAIARGERLLLERTAAGARCRFFGSRGCDFGLGRGDGLALYF